MARASTIGKVRLTTASRDEITDDTANAIQSHLVDPEGTDAIGEIQATPTSYTLLRRLKDLLTGIVLAAGTAVIGKIRLVTATGDEITDDTADAIKTKDTDGAYTTPTHTAVNVTTTSGEVLAANTNRLYALLENNTDEVMWIKLGVAAVVNQGIRIGAYGDYPMSKKSGNLYTGAINAIHNGTGNKVLLVTEGV